MQAIPTILILGTLSWASFAFATPNLPAQVKQQAALETCLIEAKKRYGSVAENSEPTKKKIGKIKGHAYKLWVGTPVKRINCIANAKGRSMFYSGRT